jgi:predicted transcriptional regulator
MTDSRQPTFFDPVPPKPVRRRRKTASTSVDAYADLGPRRPQQQRIVLETLRGHGPMTRHEVAAATGYSLQAVCGRVHELVKSGDIREVVVDGRKLVRDGRHVVEAVIANTMRRAG